MTESLAIAQKAAMSGNLKTLTDAERWQYYLAMCQHLELDPVSRPFDWIEQEGKLSLYPNANCAAQLASKMLLSFPEYHAEVIGDVYVYRVKAVDENRELWATGAVPMGRNASETARAFKKAETQARRRAVLAMGGLALTEADEIYEIGGQSPAIETNAAETQPEPEPKKTKRGRPAQALSPAPQMEPQPEPLTEAAIAEAKRVAWGWMNKLSIGKDDAIKIWNTLDNNLELIEEFLKIFPNRVPLVVGADDALRIFAGHDYLADRALPYIADYGKQIASAIAGPQPAPMPEPPPEPVKLTLPASIVETFNVYEIPESERFPIWGFFSGVTLEYGGPFQAAEDFLMFRTSKDVPNNIGLTDLLSIWRDTDGHLRKAKQAVGELVASKAADGASWHGGITKATRDLSADVVGFDSTPVWKWIKSIPLDSTKENRDRIHAIMTARGSDWGGVVADIKREFSA